MGNPRKLFALDQGAASKGVDLDYGDFKIRILPALETNPKYTAKMREVWRKNKSRMKAGPLSKDIDDKIMAEVYADAIIVGWTEVEGDDGKKIPFNRANVIALLLDAPLLFSDVRAQAEDIALFRADVTEETVKN